MAYFSQMNDDTISTEPLFSSPEIVSKLKGQLEYQIEEWEREKLILEGKISASQSILSNIRYWEKPILS